MVIKKRALFEIECLFHGKKYSIPEGFWLVIFFYYVLTYTVAMKTYRQIEEQLPELEKVLGYRFKEKKMLLLAFVHRSYFNEHRYDVDENNERLEFLGDSVLGLLVSDYLYKRFPKEPEGQLSHMRSYLVDASTCSDLLQSLGLDAWILLGRGESMNMGRGRDTIMADLFEALLGAIYLDGGLGEVRRFFFSQFEEKLDLLVDKPMRNWKAEFQAWAQKTHQVTPTYCVLEEKGPDHCKLFLVGAFIEKKLLGEGKGLSKKEAEIDAAKQAIERL